ncbi:8-amino-7-oxononanoate synthase [Kushneria sinocarnis]|uniref:8-amino-7-oxononanoate synthase n=1 Tax=Kushneria sinocarnis TaxID=595502 RepID=A0A420X1T6_9GAMM|nr:8-amino-7-oxononanoate synthase [Kushneria sinocarnis]RKR07679.1 8-amino-7-oxononanoate synthase [Kushneria sinocarnis]
MSGAGSADLDAALAPRLAERHAQARYRQRRTADRAGAHVHVDGRDVVNFCSNDYLGLAHDPRLGEALAASARRFGTGGGASHLVSGHLTPHAMLEQRLACWTGRERALLFSSGYQANTGTIAALTGRGDHVVHDRLNHASLLDGTRLAGARLHRFAHRDPAHAGQLLAGLDPARARLVVSDGVFSMDGDCADVTALAGQCRARGGWLMIDDAHGLGVLGARGAGTLEAQGVSADEVPVLVGTLGKALGTQGAFVAGSHTLIEALIQFSRPYVYTTSLSPALAGATLTALDIVRDEPERRTHLQTLIGAFRHAAERLPGIRLMPSDTPIQPLLVGRGSEAEVLALARRLADEGLWCTAIRPPTVPEGSARLRITLSAAHTHADLDRLLSALEYHCCSQELTDD